MSTVSQHRYLKIFLVFSGGGFLPCRGSIDGIQGEGTGLYSKMPFNDSLSSDDLGTWSCGGAGALLPVLICLPAIPSVQVMYVYCF